MAETTKYPVECPGCGNQWTHEADPAELTEGGDFIECPSCCMEWEWDYNVETDTLTLTDEEFEEDLEEDLEDSDQDDEDSIDGEDDQE